MKLEIRIKLNVVQYARGGFLTKLFTSGMTETIIQFTDLFEEPIIRKYWSTGALIFIKTLL